MPLYEYRCNECKREDMLVNKIDDRRIKAPECCGLRMALLISAAFISPDIEPYMAINSRRMITSRKEHRENLVANGLVEVGNDMPAWMKDKKYAEKHGATDYKVPQKEEPVDDPDVEFKYIDADKLDSNSVMIE